MKLFNAGFFKLLMGFLGMILISFVFLIGLSYYEKALEKDRLDNIGNVSQ